MPLRVSATTARARTRGHREHGRTSQHDLVQQIHLRHQDPYQRDHEPVSHESKTQKEQGSEGGDPSRKLEITHLEPHRGSHTKNPSQPVRGFTPVTTRQGLHNHEQRRPATDVTNLLDTAQHTFTQISTLTVEEKPVQTSAPRSRNSSAQRKPTGPDPTMTALWPASGLGK